MTELTAVNHLHELNEGDMMRNRLSGECYIVLRKYPEIVAVRAVRVTDVSEWVRVIKAEYVPEEAR